MPSSCDRSERTWPGQERKETQGIGPVVSLAAECDTPLSSPPFAAHRKPSLSRWSRGSVVQTASVVRPYGTAFAAPARGWHRSMRSGRGRPTATFMMVVAVRVIACAVTRPRRPAWKSHTLRLTPRATIAMRRRGTMNASTASRDTLIRSESACVCWMLVSVRLNSRRKP